MKHLPTADLRTSPTSSSPPPRRSPYSDAEEHLPAMEHLPSGLRLEATATSTMEALGRRQRLGDPRWLYFAS
uniref:Uncharacterized protein n=1 Tax=Arundo donax TaxID=35708 RepID=A0A0A9A032_ARUDO